MKTLFYLENEKKILIQNLRIGRMAWRNEYLKDRSAYLRYENHMRHFFPRSIIFRFLAKHHVWLAWLVSYFLLRKTVFPVLLKKMFS